MKQVVWWGREINRTLLFLKNIDASRMGEMGDGTDPPPKQLKKLVMKNNLGPLY
jgi:hypothetical protein